MASDPKPVIPTLHNISTPILTKLSDQLAYVVRWFFANPGRTSSNNEDELISFRKLNAQFGKYPKQMCSKVAASLELICRRYTSNVKVSCEYRESYKRDEDDVLQGTYEMDISITDTDGEPIIPHRTMKILDNGDSIDVTFSTMRG